MTSRKLTGKPQPRLWTEPLRPLTRATSLGYEMAEFAEKAGQPLLPWQRWLAIHALELDHGRRFRFRTIVVLVARQSGKSHFGRVLTLHRMVMEPGMEILGVAQELSLAKRQWQMAADMIHESPDLERRWRSGTNINGQESFTLLNGSTYRIKASNRKAGRGLTSDLVLIDELREHYNRDSWSAVTYTTMARANAQILALSNAGDDRSTVLNALRDAALAGRDPTIGIFEWSAPEGCDIEDRQAWAQSCPALGYTITEEAIANMLATDPPAVFRTEVLCQRVEQLDGAIDLAAWNDCTDTAGNMSGLREHLAACIDIALDGKHVTLAVAAKLPDGRIRIEIAGDWKDTDAARAAIPNLLDRIKPIATAWYPAGPAGALAPLLLARPRSLKLTGASAAAACMGLADLVRARRIVHNGDPLLAAHIAGARKLTSGDGWRFGRDGDGHVDAAYAAAGAAYAVLTEPPEQRARIRIIQ